MAQREKGRKNSKRKKERDRELDRDGEKTQQVHRKRDRKSRAQKDRSGERQDGDAEQNLGLSTWVGGEQVRELEKGKTAVEQQRGTEKEREGRGAGQRNGERK